MAFVTTLSTNHGTAITELLANTEYVRGNSGTSFPVSPAPVVGQVFVRTDLDLPYIYGDFDGGGNDWFAILIAYGQTDVDFNDFQLKNARLENTTSDPTPAAGNVGHGEYRTDSKYVTIVVDSSTLGYLYPLKATDYARERVPAGAFLLDATNPPTPATIGTTPTARGWEFDATNELASMGFVVPDGYVGGANDLKFRVWGYLADTQSPGDTIDFQLKWRCVAEGEAPTGTASTATVSESVGSNNAQYELQVFDLTIPYNDASNPPVAGDVLIAEISLSSVASVTGLIVEAVALLTPVKKLTEV